LGAIFSTRRGKGEEGIKMRKKRKKEEKKRVKRQIKIELKIHDNNTFTETYIEC
jgi:hypothetical protein